MNVKFDNRFSEGTNQVFIAMTGDPKEMAMKLRQMAVEIDLRGKPTQENSTTFNRECQIITPVWNGKPY
jgi:hypothetical protein